MMDASAIAEQNRRLFAQDRTMHDLSRMPAILDGVQVRQWIEQRSVRPTGPLYDRQGRVIDEAHRDAWMTSLALDRIPTSQVTRYGLVVHRASLRSFPTDERVFRRQGDTDIDRFQETAEFPGTPVVIVHTSGDGQWLFVLSARYAAWVHKADIAEGSADEVLGYGRASDARVITAAVAHTVFTPEQPALSRLGLDMGIRLPLDPRPPSMVNGQASYTSHVLRLPVRDAQGRVRFADALLPRNEDTAPDYLSLTPVHVIDQAFKFLGERYGWGHDYDARDCSGFVSEVYRSMGVQLPRNTGDQGSSPALHVQAFTAADSHEARLRAIDSLDVGDLIYIPGHVMMIIGRINGKPYVIHDTAGASYRDAGGQVRRVALNGVSVTAFLPLLSDDGTPYVDRMTDVVRMRAAP